MISICKRFKFEAAHRLPDYEGQCSSLHGHRFVVEIELTGPVNKEGSCKGMILDFSHLKKFVESKILSRLDHHYLNDIIPTPTAENICIFIRDEFEASIFQTVGVSSDLLKRVRVYETEDSYAEWREDENS